MIAGLMVVTGWLAAGNANVLRDRERITRFILPWAFFLAIRTGYQFWGGLELLPNEISALYSRNLETPEIRARQEVPLRRLAGVPDVIRGIEAGFHNMGRSEGLRRYYGPGFFPGFYTGFARRIEDFYTAITGGSRIIYQGIERPADYRMFRDLYAILLLIAAGFVVRNRPFR